MLQLISFKNISTILAATVAGLAGSAWCYDGTSPAAQIVVNYTDAISVGFNDPTLGTSRKAALEYALSLWATKIKGTETIRVQAHCESYGGTPTGAVLASAGPLTAGTVGTDVGLIYANTFYPTLLINQYGHEDFAPAHDDIQVTVNMDVDNATVLGNRNFYYGTDANPGIHIYFVTVLLHELGHGLGFLTFMDQNGMLFGGKPDGYMRNLVQQPGGSLVSMTNAGRQSAMISDALHWDGNSLKNRYNPSTSAPYGNVKMYAPAVYQAGSSVSHFDLSNSPNLLMEPSYTGASHNMDVTGNLLHDVGWYLDATALPISLSHFSLD